jgi:hypothetical protein
MNCITHLFGGCLSLFALSACSDTYCGIGTTSTLGLRASSSGAILSFGNFTGGANNDCFTPDAPPGVVSLTMSGQQLNGVGLLTLCVERPDLLATRSQNLGPNVSGTPVHLVDLNGSLGTCTFALDAARPIGGVIRASGLCNDGTNPAGFSVTVDGFATLMDSCAASVEFALSGNFAFVPSPG